jgi:hypothetical protein
MLKERDKITEGTSFWNGITVDFGRPALTDPSVSWTFNEAAVMRSSMLGV